MTTPPASPRPARHVWRSAALTPTSALAAPARLVICALAERMDDRTAVCWPSLQTLVDDTGLSERAVRQHLRTLAELGWLDVEIGGGRRSSTYRAAIPTTSTPRHDMPPTPAPDAPQPGTTNPPEGQEMPGTPAGDAPRGAPPAPESAMNQTIEAAAAAPAADEPTNLAAVVDEVYRRRRRDDVATRRSLDDPAFDAAGWRHRARQGITDEVTAAATRCPELTTAQLADHVEPPAAPNPTTTSSTARHPDDCPHCHGTTWIDADPDNTTAGVTRCPNWTTGAAAA